MQQVIERTGYVPNLLAGGLASKRTRLVAAVVPSITNAIFVDAVQALTDRLWEAGYQVLLGLSGYPATREEALLSAVLSRRPDAIYLTGINHTPQVRQRLITANIPVVETWDMTPTPIDMLVGFSHEDVGAAVARHLLARGHRAFGLIWADDARALARQRGFLGELAAQGCNDAEVVTVAGALHADAGPPRPRAALRARREAHRGVLQLGSPRPRRARGSALARPRGARRLALIGFGDLEFAQHTYPALSTVRVDRAAIGRRAAELILARIDGETPSEKVIDVGFTIVDRQTT